MPDPAPTDDAAWPEGAPPPWLGAYGAGEAPPIAAPDASSPALPTTAPSAAPPIDPSIAGAPPLEPVTPGDTGAASSLPGGADVSTPGPGAPASSAPPWIGPATGATDATSGDASAPTAAQDPHAALIALATDPSKDADQRATAWTQLTPEEQAHVVNQADPHLAAKLAVSTMSPEQLATVNVRLNQAKIADAATMQAKVAADNQAAAQRNLAAMQAANAHADAATQATLADAKALAAHPTGPQFGIGNLIGGALAAAVGGAFARNTGGQNLGLMGWQKGVEQQIQAQREQIANGWHAVDLKNNAIAQQYQRTGDLYRAQETYRLASYDSAESALQTQLQNYDPQGTTATAIAGHVQQIQAARQQSVMALHQQNFKNGMDLAKAQQEAAAQQETARHNKAGEGLEWAKFGLEKTKATAALGADAPVPIAQLAAQNPTAPVPPAAAFPGGAMKPSQYTKWLSDQKTSGEISGTAVENQQKNAAGQVFSPATGKPYVVDGKPVQISPTVAVEINKRSAGAQQYLDAMSSVKRELAADPSTIDRQKWAEINSNLETAKASWTQMYGAKASSREMEAASDVVGANFDGYAARIKDKGTAIMSIGTQIDSTKRNLNTELKGMAGIPNAKADLIDTSEPPPSKPTAADKTVETLTTNYGAADVDAGALDANDRAFALASRAGITERSPQEQAQYAADNGLAPQALRALHTGVAPSQIKELDGLEADAIGADTAARTAAIARLAVVAGSSKSPAVRSYARALIGKASADATSSIPAAADDLEPEVR